MDIRCWMRCGNCSGCRISDGPSPSRKRKRRNQAPRTAAFSAGRKWESEPAVRLMLRSKADEPGAFTELIESWWPRIFGRFYKQLGDRQEAEDLAQDATTLARLRLEARAAFGLNHHGICTVYEIGDQGGSAFIAME